MLLLNVILLVAYSIHDGTAQLSFEEKYIVWAADLRPGFAIQVSQLDSRRCFCKVKANNTLPTTIQPQPQGPTIINSSDGCDPNCNVNYVIGAGQVGTTLSWSSPGWTEACKYPPGCTCVLNVEVLANATITANLNSLANISCPDDHLILEGDMSTSSMCGDSIGGSLGQLTNNVSGSSSSFTAKFISGARQGGDNDTASGFNLNIIVSEPAVIKTSTTSKDTTTATTTLGALNAECPLECNKTITIDSSYGGELLEWGSPGWTEGLNYPESCACVLTVKVLTPATIQTSFNSCSVIVGSPGSCLHDSLYYTDITSGSSSYPFDTDFCGSLSYLVNSVTNPGPEELIFTITFNATDTDDGVTDVGYSLKLTAILPSTTTTRIPTTTPLQSTCDPSCNRTIVIDNNWTGDLEWNSPGWDQSLPYPEDCVCILTVEVLSSASVTTSFNLSSMIAGTPGSCAHDNIDYTGDIDAGPYCGSLSFLTQSVTNIHPGSKTFQVTFTSTKADGNLTDDGFSLIISAMIFTTTTTVPTTTTEKIAECDPSCNQTILIDDEWMGQEFTWSSLGWGEGLNYPDNCICILTVDISATATVTTTFNVTSMLTASPGSCTGDNIVYEGAINSPMYCGELGYLTQSTSNIFPGIKTFTVTFNTTGIDGTDVGFSLMLTAVVFTTTTSTTTTTPQIATCDASCNTTVVFDSSWTGEEIFWATPGWYEGLDYPENCVCILTVEILSTAEVTTAFDPLSMLSGTPGDCEDDMLKYSTGGLMYCGSLAFVTQTNTNIGPGNTTFTITFTSTDVDGGLTDVGFELILKAIVFTTTTSTTTSTTTTVPLGECDPSCNQTVLVDDNWDNDGFVWTSPGWSEGFDYPDNCICILTVQIITSAVVTTSFNSSSYIAGTSGSCNDDNLQYSTNLDGTKYCEDDLATLTQTVTNISPNNTVFTVTFTSTDKDNDWTDYGFALLLDAILIKPSTTTTTLTTTPVETGVCSPSCNRTVVIDSNSIDSTLTWNSPGWDEQLNYPDDCVCILDVHIVTTATVELNFNVSSILSGVPGDCTGDNLKFQGDLSSVMYCGQLGFITQKVDNMAPASKVFSVTFTSTDVDTIDVGFSLNLIVMVFTTTSSTSTTSTTTTSTSTTSTTTTTEASADCDPSCNVTIVVDKNWSEDSFTWSSLGWDEGINYPENCICVLTVQIETSATVAVSFNESSVIAGISGTCSHDSIFFSDDIDTADYCSTDLGSLEKSITNIAPSTTTFTVTFTTSDTDGGLADLGFSLNLFVSLISTTSTSTSTSTSSTTSTSTSTSTTSTPSTTSTTTSSTTTTRAETTSSTTTTTTTASPGECGNCNKTMMIDYDTVDGRYTWSSTGWDKGDNYPDGCICILYVNITTYSSIRITFNENSVIYGEDNCAYDHLDIEGTDISTKKHCDSSVRDVEESIYQFAPGLKNFTVTFKTAVELDGSVTDVGFELYLDVLIYKWDIAGRMDPKQLLDY